jgi:hypothetical protein
VQGVTLDVDGSETARNYGAADVSGWGHDRRTATIHGVARHRHTDDVAWMFDLIGGVLLSRGTSSARGLILGAPEEATIEQALDEALLLAVSSVIDPDHDREFAVSALREHLRGPDARSAKAGNLSDEVRQQFAKRLEPVWFVDDGSHASGMGLGCSLDEFVDSLLVRFVDALGLRASAVGPLSGAVALLQTQRNASRNGALLLSGVGDQALRIAAWISVWSDPPEVRVMNPTDSPIFNVRPTPALIAYDERGEISAMVGRSALHLVRQIDPLSGYVWPMSHCSRWSSQPSIASELHLNFRDASGRGWLRAHDRIVEAADPWGDAS